MALDRPLAPAAAHRHVQVTAMSVTAMSVTDRCCSSARAGGRCKRSSSAAPYRSTCTASWIRTWRSLVWSSAVVSASSPRP